MNCWTTRYSTRSSTYTRTPRSTDFLKLPFSRRVSSTVNTFTSWKERCSIRGIPKNRITLNKDLPQYPTSNIASTKNVRRLPRRRIAIIHLPSVSLRSLPNISPMTPPHTKIIRLLFILYSLLNRKTLYFSLYISIFLLSSSSEVLYFIEIASFSPKFRLGSGNPWFSMEFPLLSLLLKTLHLYNEIKGKCVWSTFSAPEK